MLAMKKLQFLLVLLLFILAACSPGPESGNGSGLKTYRHSMDGAPVTLDPVQSATVYTNHMVVNLYDTLYSYKYLARPYELKPSLAEDFPEISEDGLSYTIRLKKGVFFIDDPAFPDGKGRELLAEDFVYSMKRHFDAENRSQGFWLWEGKVAGIEEWKEAGADYDQPIKGFEALDSHTVRVNLKKPYPQLVHTLAQGFAGVVPREAVEFYGKEFSIHPVGSGPFRLKSFDSARAVLLKNEKYRQEPIDLAYEGYDASLHAGFGIEQIEGKTPPLVDQLEIHFIAESAARWNSFTKGNETHFLGVPVEQVNTVTETLKPTVTLKPEYAEKYNVTNAVESGFVHVDFNMRMPHIGYNDDPEQNEKNRALRCAIRTAFDWDERNERFYSGIGVVFPGIIVPVTPEFDENLSRESVSHDLEKAKAMLADAGWTPDTLPTLSYGGVASVIQRQFFEQFRGWMLDLGFPREKIVYETFATFGDYNKAVKQAKLDIVSMGWGLDYPDSQNTLQLFYGPHGSPGANNSNYSNPEFDRLYEESVVMQPSPERTEIYRRMNQMVIDDCVSISGLSRNRVMMWHKNVVSYPDRQIVGGFHIKYVDFKDKAEAP